MRIVYVLTTLAMGGTERQVLAIAGRMAARGHAVALLVLKPHDPDGCVTDLEVLHLDIRKDVPSLIAGFGRALAYLRAFRPDVIHSHNFHGNMLARIMHLFSWRVRLISTIHNVYEGGPLRMMAYRVTDGLADRTTAVSAAVSERFVRLYAVGKGRCVVITNGIETAEFVPDAKRRIAMRAEMGVADEFVWLSVGRMTAAKDFPNLLQAFGNVCRTREDTRLWIAGEAPARESGRQRAFLVAMPHGASSRIRLLGLRRDVPALLDAADGFVLASAWEGMPLALGEAMAMEKPVVATDVGGVCELVGEAGARAPAKDAHALADAMLHMMNRTPEERASLGQAARARVLTQFSMDAKAGEWEALYRSLLVG